MSTVKPITASSDQSVRDVLQAILDRADHFSGVIIVAQGKDGEEYLRSSKMKLREKVGLFVFFQAYIMSLYNIVYDDKNDGE